MDLPYDDGAPPAAEARWPGLGLMDMAYGERADEMRRLVRERQDRERLLRRAPSQALPGSQPAAASMRRLLRKLVRREVRRAVELLRAEIMHEVAAMVQEMRGGRRGRP